MGFLIRVFFCIFLVGFFLYSYILKQNELTQVRLNIPLIKRELKKITEENRKLDYEIDRFESPIHLMELAKRAEHSHLIHPYVKDIIILPEGDLSELNLESVNGAH